MLKENFEIINPENLNIEDLSNKIRNSEILISEKASVYNNNFLFRDRPFFLLSSKNEIKLEKKFFIGAGIYKTFLNGIINEIFFEDDYEFQNEKPFKKRIKVDLKILTKVLNEKKKIKDCFLNSPYSSTKHDSYFNTYDELFSKYIGKEITFVEIGVLNGGSLFMWKDYFGEKARIIGIDNNSNAKYWEKYGFKFL